MDQVVFVNMCVGFYLHQECFISQVSQGTMTTSSKV